MGAIVSEGQMKTISEYVDSAKEEGAEVFQPDLPTPPHGLFYPPTLITKIQTVSKCVREEVSIAVSSNCRSVLQFAHMSPKLTLPGDRETILPVFESSWHLLPF